MSSPESPGNHEREYSREEVEGLISHAAHDERLDPSSRIAALKAAIAYDEKHPEEISRDAIYHFEESMATHAIRKVMHYRGVALVYRNGNAGPGAYAGVTAINPERAEALELLAQVTIGSTGRVRLLGAYVGRIAEDDPIVEHDPSQYVSFRIWQHHIDGGQNLDNAMIAFTDAPIGLHPPEPILRDPVLQS